MRSYIFVIFEFGQTSHHKIWTNFQAQQSRRGHCRKRTAIVAVFGTAVLSFSRTGMDGVTILRTGYDWICDPNGLENLNGIFWAAKQNVRCSITPKQVSLCVTASFWSILFFFGTIGTTLDNCNMWFVGSAINFGFQFTVQHEECKRSAAAS